MRKLAHSFFCLATAMLLAMSASASETGETAYEYEDCGFYAGAGASLILPQGGGDLRRLAGATARAGWYVTEFWAVECEAAMMENNAQLGLSALWHWWGYEQFDPFFRFGAKGLIGRCDELGPMAGVGAFYHLTDNLSLRFDADAVLGLEGANEAVYQLGVGVQWSF
jgi:hypothetical protein